MAHPKKVLIHKLKTDKGKSGVYPQADIQIFTLNPRKCQASKEKGVHSTKVGKMLVNI
jgi:hypothetical protein